MPKIILGLGVVVFLGGGAYYYMQSSGQLNGQVAQEEAGMEEGMMEEEGLMEGDAMVEGEGMMTEEYVVTYTDSGFSPAERTIHKGDTVMFKNESSRDTWPATAIHPSHTVYPGSSIQKCFDEAEDKSLLFDACGAVAPGSSWSFTFAEAGTWKYHDHLRAADTGTIIVEE